MKTGKTFKTIACIFSVLLLSLSSLALADEVFVDCRNMAGPWDGSVDNPFQTIQGAIDADTTYDGDSIRVSDGIYEEGLIVNKLLKIYGAGPDITYLDATDTGKDAAVTVPESIELTISGFRISSPKYGVFINSYSNTIISNNIISAEYGIYCGNRRRSNTEIKNNTIVACSKDGIYMYGDSYWVTAKIYNNIIALNGGCGLNVRYTNLTVFDNNIWSNGTNYCGCSAGTGSISENPRFVDSSTGNYRLMPLSPCIDAGWPVKTELDPDGTRNNMGAYGGPGAAGFWPGSPGAPVVTDLVVTPAAVPSNGTISIRARGRVRPYSSGQE